LNIESEIRLTEFSHGTGCGCKIAPEVLKSILGKIKKSVPDPNLLVGNTFNDDASAYKINDEFAILNTADFFMPVVNNPYDFGRIASANALSDIFAMGGNPLTATAILGWPVEKINPEIATQVLQGASDLCAEVNIQVSGGHSIDNPEPFFGLSVSGIIQIKHLKKNNGSAEKDLLFLTKPLGSGTLTTALKKNLLTNSEYSELLQVLAALNFEGSWLGTKEYITSMTDVTGFGLLGHLHEMISPDSLGAELTLAQIPVLSSFNKYATRFIIPDNTFRNWNAVEPFVSGTISPFYFQLLNDPQTNGGLLFTVKPEFKQEFQRDFALQFPKKNLWEIGKITSTSKITFI